MKITDLLNEVSDKISSLQSNGINVTDEHINAVDDATEEITRLREALEFYADVRTYMKQPSQHSFMHMLPSPISKDEGEIARKALEGGE